MNEGFAASTKIRQELSILILYLSRRRTVVFIISLMMLTPAFAQGDNMSGGGNYTEGNMTGSDMAGSGMATPPTTTTP